VGNQRWCQRKEGTGAYQVGSGKFLAWPLRQLGKWMDGWMSGLGFGFGEADELVAEKRKCNSSVLGKTLEANDQSSGAGTGVVLNGHWKPD